MNTYGSGRMSSTSITMTATVRARLNQMSFGRRVGRSGSSIVSAMAVSAGSTLAAETGACPPATTTRLPVRSEARAPGFGSAPRKIFGTVESVPPVGTDQQPLGIQATESPALLQAQDPCEARVTTIPAPSAGSIGTKMSVGCNPRAVAARTVGPPHGTMFSVPFMRPATQVSTTGLIPRRR